MTTVHIIFNAHLDPIWLWSWREGLDEVLNTGYYICNLLDRHPDIIYTRGESWFYEQIQRVDPPLFARIKKHVEAGRWSPVGGWYIQPDCNLPSGFAMKRQIETGRRQFLDYFGEFPRVAYNVDSFGHAAALPDLMRQAGQEFYVMMRPDDHEAKLPARLFRWRGYDGGGEVITFRIAQGYCTSEGISEQQIHAALTELPEGISHTMCFVGVGDHGGGPTEEMIAWCREHRNSFPGVELVFSSPEKFFSAIQQDRSKLPEVVGELQMHAVGCYSVHRPVKVALRRAEHRLAQAEFTLQACNTAAETDAALLEAAWKRVCFHHFHDTLCGTCIPSAFRDVEAQLGEALAAADDVATYALRKRILQLGDDAAQRMVFLNASDHPFEDYVEAEPWIEWTPWSPSWRLVDENNKPVSHQVIDPESSGGVQVRLLFPVSAQPGELRTFRIVNSDRIQESAPSTLAITSDSLATIGGASLNLGKAAGMDFPMLQGFSLPVLAAYDDLSDTWSHNVARYPRENQELALWQEPQLLDRGPLMGSLVQQGSIGRSELHIEWRVYDGQPWVECQLRVGWMEKRRILKFEWSLPWGISMREDGIMNGSLIRETDGVERPLRDWVHLGLKQENRALDVGVVAPDVYSVDCTSRRLSLTLLRSPLMAWHDPNPGTQPRAVFSDRGEHFFRFRFLAAEQLTPAALDQMASGWQRPPLFAEVTRGMKNRNLRNKYTPV